MVLLLVGNFATAGNMIPDGYYSGYRAQTTKIIEKSGLADSIKGKQHCVIFSSGCFGIGCWMIATHNKCGFQVFYTDSLMPSDEFRCQKVITKAEDADLSQLFSLLELGQTLKRNSDSKFYATFNLYLALFDENGRIVLEWDLRNPFAKRKLNQLISATYAKFCIDGFLNPGD